MTKAQRTLDSRVEGWPFSSTKADFATCSTVRPLRRTTQHGYQAVLRVHVLQRREDIPLRDIDRLAIQQWAANRFRQGVGWQSVRNSWVLLSIILEAAVEHGYLQANPARGVKFPQKALKNKPTMIAGDIPRNCSHS